MESGAGVNFHCQQIDTNYSNPFTSNNMKHDKERVIELSSSLLALGKVQETISRTFRDLREEMIPMYASTIMERADAVKRVHQIMDPVENELISIVMFNTANITNELNRK